MVGCDTYVYWSIQDMCMNVNTTVKFTLYRAQRILNMVSTLQVLESALLPLNLGSSVALHGHALWLEVSSNLEVISSRSKRRDTTRELERQAISANRQRPWIADNAGAPQRTNWVKVFLRQARLSTTSMTLQYSKRCVWGLSKSDLRYPEQQAGGVRFTPFPWRNSWT